MPAQPQQGNSLSKTIMGKYLKDVMGIRRSQNQYSQSKTNKSTPSLHYCSSIPTSGADLTHYVQVVSDELKKSGMYVEDRCMHYSPINDPALLLNFGWGSNELKGDNIIHVAPAWIGEMFSFADKIRGMSDGVLKPNGSDGDMPIHNDNVSAAVKSILSLKSRVTSAVRDKYYALGKVTDLDIVGAALCTAPVVTAARVTTNISYVNPSQEKKIATTPTYISGTPDRHVVINNKILDFNAAASNRLFREVDGIFRQTTKDSFVSCLVAATKLNSHVMCVPPIGLGHAKNDDEQFSSYVHSNYVSGIADSLKDYSECGQYKDYPMHIVLSSHDVPNLQGDSVIKLREWAKDHGWVIHDGGTKDPFQVNSITISHPQHDISFTVVDESLVLLQAVYKNRYGHRYGDISLVTGGVLDVPSREIGLRSKVADISRGGLTDTAWHYEWQNADFDIENRYTVPLPPLGSAEDMVTSIAPSAIVSCDIMCGTSTSTGQSYVYSLINNEGKSNLPEVYRDAFVSIDEQMSDRLKEVKQEKKVERDDKVEVNVDLHDVAFDQHNHWRELEHAPISDGVSMLVRLLPHIIGAGNNSYSAYREMKILSDSVFADDLTRSVKGALRIKAAKVLNGGGGAEVLYLMPVYAAMFSSSNTSPTQDELIAISNFYYDLFCIVQYHTPTMELTTFLNRIDSMGGVMLDEAMLGFGIEDGLVQFICGLLDKKGKDLMEINNAQLPDDIEENPIIPEIRTYIKKNILQSNAHQVVKDKLRIYSRLLENKHMHNADTGAALYMLEESKDDNNKEAVGTNAKDRDPTGRVGGYLGENDKGNVDSSADASQKKFEIKIDGVLFLVASNYLKKSPLKKIINKKPPLALLWLLCRPFDIVMSALGLDRAYIHIPSTKSELPSLTNSNSLDGSSADVSKDHEMSGPGIQVQSLASKMAEQSFADMDEFTEDEAEVDGGLDFEWDFTDTDGQSLYGLGINDDELFEDEGELDSAIRQGLFEVSATPKESFYDLDSDDDIKTLHDVLDKDQKEHLNISFSDTDDEYKDSVEDASQPNAPSTSINDTNTKQSLPNQSQKNT